MRRSSGLILRPQGRGCVGGCGYRRHVDEHATSGGGDPFGEHGPAPDPLDAHLDLDHAGVARLRAAVDLLDAGDVAGSVEAALQARAHGVPAELVPYLAIVDGVAAVLAGDAPRAEVVLGDAWRAHPDVAALPAALGAARLLAGDATSAAHSMYAALVSDDPDRSLAVHRRRLTMLLGALRRDA